MSSLNALALVHCESGVEKELRRIKSKFTSSEPDIRARKGPDVGYLHALTTPNRGLWAESPKHV